MLVEMAAELDTFLSGVSPWLVFTSLVSRGVVEIDVDVAVELPCTVVSCDDELVVSMMGGDLHIISQSVSHTCHMHTTRLTQSVFLQCLPLVPLLSPCPCPFLRLSSPRLSPPFQDS